MARYNSVKCLLWTFSVVGICLLINFTHTQSIADPVVTIPEGTLQGTIQTTYYGRNISAFLGIPYAEPPIGNLRFANPVAVGNWSGIRNASVHRDECPQDGNSQQDEDCLHLNVFTPRLPENTNSSLLPVMVFIHGGGFAHGSSTMSDAYYFLDKDVLLVAPQYRLGAFGFLSTGDEVAPGNWALKDQTLALEWVQKNIEFFGGDPNQVTLFGESAGSFSVHLLTLSDATEGLFHKYITQSGVVLSHFAYRPSAGYAARAFELGEYLGCATDSSDVLINCLRTVNTSDILAAYSHFVVWNNHPSVVWGPTDEPDIEGAALTDSPANLFAAGKIRDLPWINGVCRDEGLLHTQSLYDNEELLAELLDNFDSYLPLMLNWMYHADSGTAWVDAAKSYYFDDDLTGNSSVLLPQLTILLTDAGFFYPAHKALQQQLALAVNPQYFYSLNYQGSGSSEYGVTHGSELNSIFSSTAFEMTETDLEVMNIIISLWTSFAINGIPVSSAISGTWEPYSSQENYLRIGDGSESTSEMQYSFFEERMQFWADLEASTQATELVSASSALHSTPILLLALLLLSSQFVQA